MEVQELAIAVLADGAQIRCEELHAPSVSRVERFSTSATGGSVACWSQVILATADKLTDCWPWF